MAASTMVERVQVIASLAASGDNIPAEFIRAESERPGLHGSVAEVPVVDLSWSDREQLVSAVASAASEWGMFQVVNHGIPAGVTEELKRVGKEFFELPQEEKERYAAPAGGATFEGYGTKLQKEVDGKKAWVDFLFHNIHPSWKVNPSVWPSKPPSYAEANREYARHMEKVVRSVMGLLSLGAGLQEDDLWSVVGGDEMEMLLKINYYPPCPRPDLALGVVQHTDMSALTVLVPNHVQGLQAFKDDRWYDVAYVPDALIVHIGDQFEILTNGKYKAVLHRTTVNKNETRMSWPVFCSPPENAVIGPLPSFVTADNPARYNRNKYKDYAFRKINKLPQ